MKQLLLATLLLGGCQTDGGQPVALDDLGAAVSSVYCVRTFDCFSASERQEILGSDPAVQTETGCESYIEGLLAPVLAQYEQMIAAGKLVYDGDAATSCLSRVSDATCRDVRIGFDYVSRPCQEAFKPSP